MPSVDTGTASRLRLEAYVSQSSAAGRWSDVTWAAYFEERGGPNLAYNGSVAANVHFSNLGYVWSGNFAFDWRRPGNQSVLVASGTTRVNHNADGTPPSGFTITFNTGATGSSGGGPGASVAYALPLATLKVVPGTPTGVTATRVSDTSVTVAWAQSSASNGAPTSNTIRRKINDGAFEAVAVISPATSAAISAAANQKLVYGVKATNTAGSSAWSADSSPLFTTPAAPTDVTATKVGFDIELEWTPNVAFAEHKHVIEHGVDVAGVITWDGSALATVSAGTSSYVHEDPDPGDRHVYRVRARNTDPAALSSATVQSNVVQLLAPPAKPTVAAPAAYQDKAAAFRFAWTHNAVDTTAQTKRQVRYSTDGGDTWTTGAKTTSSEQYLDFPASTWAANQAVTFQVRTKGGYDDGADGDSAYSPWSDPVTVTFKTRPVATITSPADSSTVEAASVSAVLGFAQAEGATFVNATLRLYAGATLLEERTTTTLAGTPLQTRLEDGATYTLTARVRDSNGLLSSEVTAEFDVDYVEPVAALADLEYSPDSGVTQIRVTIPEPDEDFVEAVAITIDRIIAGTSERLVTAYPAAPTLTFLDTTPTVHGTNLYRITTHSADGATTVITRELTTTENEWAFLSKGSGYGSIVRFQLAPGLTITPTVDSSLLKAAGRRRPLALYATTGDLVVSGKGALAEGYGSTPEELEQFVLIPGKACYRDPTGRRVFGRLTASLNRDNAELGELGFTLEETS